MWGFLIFLLSQSMWEKSGLEAVIDPIKGCIFFFFFFNLCGTNTGRGLAVISYIFYTRHLLQCGRPAVLSIWDRFCHCMKGFPFIPMGMKRVCRVEASARSCLTLQVTDNCGRAWWILVGIYPSELKYLIQCTRRYWGNKMVVSARINAAVPPRRQSWSYFLLSFTPTISFYLKWGNYFSGLHLNS